MRADKGSTQLLVESALRSAPLVMEGPFVFDTLVADVLWVFGRGFEV